MNRLKKYFTVRRTIVAVLMVFVVSLALPAIAGEVVFTKRGKAINGYDPVAYFTEGEPTKGKKEFTTKWMGSTWRMDGSFMCRTASSSRIRPEGAR